MLIISSAAAAAAASREPNRSSLNRPLLTEMNVKTV